MCVIILIMFTSLQAEDEVERYIHDFQIQRIKGVKCINQVSVWLECNNPKSFNLNEEKIKSEVEFMLKLCGLQLNAGSYVANEPSVTIHIQIFEGLSCAATTKIKIIEDVISCRTKQKCAGFIWQKDELFLSEDKPELGKSIMHAIHSQLEEFLNLYLEANPRKFAEDVAL